MDNNKQMPGMPESNKKPAEQSAGLSVPSQEVVLPKVELETPETKASTEVNIPLVPKDGIEVVATREGFYNQMRIKKNFKFKVSKMDHLGEWMSCVDPVMERERVRKIQQKKANR